jgi:hypothetical protein
VETSPNLAPTTTTTSQTQMQNNTGFCLAGGVHQSNIWPVNSNNKYSPTPFNN